MGGSLPLGVPVWGGRGASLNHLGPLLVGPCPSWGGPQAGGSLHPHGVLTGGTPSHGGGGGGKPCPWGGPYTLTGAGPVWGAPYC